MSEVVQLDLGGSITDHPRRTPDTFVTCAECGERMLRSRRHDHEHDVEGEDSHVGGCNLKRRAQDESDDENDGGDGDEQAEVVGRLFDVTLSYSVDYRFRIPAWSKHEAKDVAKELAMDASPSDSMLVHTRRDEVSEIYEDDPKLPDDYDPYGGERLIDVYGKGGGR